MFISDLYGCSIRYLTDLLNAILWYQPTESTLNLLIISRQLCLKLYILKNF